MLLNYMHNIRFYILKTVILCCLVLRNKIKLKKNNIVSSFALQLHFVYMHTVSRLYVNNNVLVYIYSRLIYNVRVRVCVGVCISVCAV